MSEKHKWTFAEEYNCCLHYIWCVFDYMGDDSLKTIVDMLAEEMPHIDRGSLRMKIQNIKAVALDAGLEDRFEFSPLSKYTLLCKMAFRAATDDYGILKDKYDGGLSGTVSRAELMDTLWRKTDELTPRDECLLVIADDTYMDDYSKYLAEKRRESGEDK